MKNALTFVFHIFVFINFSLGFSHLDNGHFLLNEKINVTENKAIELDYGENIVLYASLDQFDPCDSASPDYNPCDPNCPEYDPCYCNGGVGGDPCNPDCPDYDPCLCQPDPCNPDCPDYDYCACNQDPCDMQCPNYNPCDSTCVNYDPCLCASASGTDICDPTCAGYEPCNPNCPDYDYCACNQDPCNPDCPDTYDPCYCNGGTGDPCNPDCPDYDPCLCNPDPCDPACPGYDPCTCTIDPCNPDCPDYDYCACNQDPCDMQCPNYNPCDSTCVNYDPCLCAAASGTDICDPTCAGYEPCNPNCPDYDYCYCNPDPCDPNCPDFDPCDTTCSTYDPCICNPDPCDPSCPDYDYCYCNQDPCNPDCPDTYDPCYCNPDPCDPNCPGYDPCDATCTTYDPCNPDCPDYDYCYCNPDPCDPNCPDYDPCYCQPDPCNPDCPEYDYCYCNPDPCDPTCPNYDPCYCQPDPCNPDCPEYDECICIPENCTSCHDGIQNGNETGVDCGGPDCPPCIGCETNGNIFVDINATGANDGSSWTDAFTDLQSALAIGSYKSIHIAEGLYLPTSTGSRGASFNMPNGVTILGGYPTGGGGRDSDSYNTTLSGEIDGVSGLAGNSYHVVKAQNVSCVTIDGVTIKHGSATDASSFGRSRGAGIYAISSELTLSNSKVKWNKAIKGGGTFASRCPNFTILTSEYSNNTANNGSALYHSNQTNMYIIKSRAINNNSLNRAAIEVNNSLYTRIENSVIANNPSKNANAIALIATNRDQTIEVYNTTILGETKDKNLVTLQVGYGDQLDATFFNSIIAHQDLSFTRAFKDYNNGILNLHTSHCYIQGSSVIGGSIGNLYSATAGDLMLNPDYSVNECSPVVDAGDDAVAALPVDINENNRIFDVVDMGAYEAQVPCAIGTRKSMDSRTAVTIFPNPTRGELSIQTLEENITISIYDILGKRMTYTTLREINISSYPSGIYILNIERDGEIIHVEKVIKE